MCLLRACLYSQKKRHSLEFLRSIAHLRPRTNMLGAVARVRSASATLAEALFICEEPVVVPMDASLVHWRVPFSF